MRTTKIFKAGLFLPIAVGEMLIALQVFLFVPLPTKYFHGKSAT